MARKSLPVLLFILVLMILITTLLTACEEAGTPQPTTVSKPPTPAVIQEATPAAPATRAEGYPTPIGYPAP